MKQISLTLATLVVAAGAFAQTQPQTSASAATTSAASAPSAEQRAARREARIEQRIKYLHDQLKITPAQESQWKTFADTMRDNGDTMGRLYRARMESRNVSAVDDMKQLPGRAEGARRHDVPQLAAPRRRAPPQGQREGRQGRGRPGRERAGAAVILRPYGGRPPCPPRPGGAAHPACSSRRVSHGASISG